MNTISQEEYRQYLLIKLLLILKFIKQINEIPFCIVCKNGGMHFIYTMTEGPVYICTNCGARLLKIIDYIRIIRQFYNRDNNLPVKLKNDIYVFVNDMDVYKIFKRSYRQE